MVKSNNVRLMNKDNLLEIFTEEIKYLTKVSALIDYYLQLHNIEVPDWLRDNRLSFEKPYYHSKRISDFEKLKLLYNNPSPFKARNVYFDLQGIKRI